tara:strand:+ start:924 stop:1172 length:249 start_codon:yes stop_codon:yes gene_type:complete
MQTPVNEDTMCAIALFISLYEGISEDNAPKVDIRINAGVCTQFADSIEPNVMDSSIMLSASNTHFSLSLLIVLLVAYIYFSS